MGSDSDDEKRFVRANGQAAYWAVATYFLSAVLNAVTLLASEWRATPPGVQGYPGRRTWGLLYVSGVQQTSHYNMYWDTCKRMGAFDVGGLCVSPLCQWYRIKCYAYQFCLWGSYGAAAAVGLSMLLCVLCGIWTLHHRPHTLRWAFAWGSLSVASQGLGVAAWVYTTESMFDMLQSESLYPRAFYSLCFYLSCFTLLLTSVNVMVVCGSYRVESAKYGDSSSSSDELTEEEEEFQTLMDQAGQSQAPGLGGPSGPWAHTGVAAPPVSMPVTRSAQTPQTRDGDVVVAGGGGDWGGSGGEWGGDTNWSGGDWQ